MWTIAGGILLALFILCVVLPFCLSALAALFVLLTQIIVLPFELVGRVRNTLVEFIRNIKKARRR